MTVFRAWHETSGTAYSVGQQDKQFRATKTKRSNSTQVDVARNDAEFCASRRFQPRKASPPRSPASSRLKLAEITQPAGAQACAEIRDHLWQHALSVLHSRRPQDKRALECGSVHESSPPSVDEGVRQGPVMGCVAAPHRWSSCFGINRATRKISHPKQYRKTLRERGQALGTSSRTHWHHATLSVSMPEIAATRLSSVTSSVVNVRIIRP